MCKKKYKNREEVILRKKYSEIKHRHTFRLNFPENKIISFDKFCLLAKRKCFYCDEPYSLELIDYNKVLFSDTVVKINGIDRINNNKGYESGNIITCCKTCNIMRGSLSQAEFYLQIIKIKKKMERKENDWKKKK